MDEWMNEILMNDWVSGYWNELGGQDWMKWNGMDGRMKLEMDRIIGQGSDLIRQVGGWDRKDG